MQKRMISRFLKMASVATVGMVFGSGCAILDLVNSLLFNSLAGLDITSILAGLLGTTNGV